MSEWWSYRPSDFLMFSPHIYWRLFASLNEAFWPAQLLLLGAAITWLARGRPARLGAAALVLAWGVVAWAFVLERYAPINWAAPVAAAVFGAQALLLAALAAFGGLGPVGEPARRRAGLALALWSLLGHPLLAPAFGRPWVQAELFGLAPDPTAIGTLAFLLLIRGERPAARLGLALAWLAPALWLVFSAATLATMGEAQAAVLLAALAASLAARMGLGEFLLSKRARLR